MIRVTGERFERITKMAETVEGRRNWKTLVVEDIEVMRKMMEHLAKTHIGPTDVCADGTEALVLYDVAIEHDTPYDLILLDLEMPSMDGNDVVNEIRAREEAAQSSKKVKIVIVTGYPDEEQIKEWFTDGHDGYIVKPVNKEKLLDVIDTL
jgi:two-component system, chemotaxis family, chemotaxis protein CheY